MNKFYVLLVGIIRFGANERDLGAAFYLIGEGDSIAYLCFVWLCMAEHSTVPAHTQSSDFTALREIEVLRWGTRLINC